MSFDEFRIGKRGENDCSYHDWREWLKTRGIEELSEQERVERGGDNFVFVCYGELVELKLWERP